MEFQEEYEKLRTQDKNQFAQVLNSLLFHCYSVRKRYDRTTGMDKFQSDYAFIERHFSLFESYLSIMDIVLSKDDDAGVIFIRSDQDRNTERFNTATTLVVFALRIYYEEQLEKHPSNLEVGMDSNLLRQELSDLGLSTAAKRLSLDQISQAMKTLQSYNIVVLAKGSFNDATYSFYILPSIRYIIDKNRMNALYRYASGDVGNSELEPEPEPEIQAQAQAQPEVPAETETAADAEGAAEEIETEDTGESESEEDAQDDSDDPAPEGF